ncbi:MAG: 30S ribosomal protein S3 [archaeon]|nr:30S ribosomal protein S3 [archaeon]
MDEKKFVAFKKKEYAMKKYVWNSLGKGKVSSIRVEYTPVGEKIVIATDKPGLIIGSRGEKIDNLTRVLKQKFKLENPNVEINEIKNVSLDAQLVADRIALDLERFGNLKFKTIAYKELVKIMKAGALGVELRLSGKLPSDRAKSWRFAAGYLKKVGDSAKVVGKAQSVALTKLGISGIKVAILPPDAKIHDRIDITDDLKKLININPEIIEELEEKKTKKPRKKKESIEIKTEEIKE